MKYKKVLAMILAIGMLVGLFAGCGNQSTNSSGSQNSNSSQQSSSDDGSSGDTIRVGVLYPLTGNTASSGNEAVNCLKVAAEIINGSYDIDFPGAKTEGIQSMGGAKIEIVTADTQGSAEVAATEAERLITEENVVALIGCDLSSGTKTASAVAERYGVPMFNGESSSDTLISSGLEYFFHVGPCDSTLIASTYDYLDTIRDTVGIESVAICGSDDDPGTMFVQFAEQYAEERGYEITSSFTYPPEASTLSSECLKLKAAGGDALLIYGQNPASIVFLQTFEEMDINYKTMITARGGFINTEFFDAVGDTAEYLMTENTWSLDSVSDKPWVEEINNMCIEQAGVALNGNYARALQAFFVLVDVLERAGSTDGEALKEAAQATDLGPEAMICAWDGVKFDERGQNIYAAGIMTQVQNGEYVTIWPEIAEPVVPIPTWSER